MWVVLETTLKRITALLLGVVGETWAWVLWIDLLLFNVLILSLPGAAFPQPSLLLS